VATTQINAKKIRVLPGFKLTLGYTVLYLSLIVLIPLAAAFVKTSTLTWAEFSHDVFSRQAMASYRLSFGASLLAALVNAGFGLIVAWVLVRYEFPGRKLLDALVDLPFALPTAVAGITLATIYAENGWLGHFFSTGGGWHVWLHLPAIKISFTRLGVFVALTFIGLPFIVRTVQPVLEDFEPEIEEAAASLGATRWQAFWRIILPTLLPALLTGFALAFARALGEYGSVVFISSNIPMKTQITPLLIMTRLEEFDYAGATALAVVMLVASFVILLTINLLQWRTSRFHATHLS
jgi:sulfate transport system permease protein